MHPSIAKYSPIELLYHHIEISDLALRRIQKNSHLVSKQPTFDHFIFFHSEEDSFFNGNSWIKRKPIQLSYHYEVI